jgi:hypothetical protein
LPPSRDSLRELRVAAPACSTTSLREHSHFATIAADFEAMARHAEAMSHSASSAR